MLYDATAAPHAGPSGSAPVALPPPAPGRPQPIAPWWHTVALFLILLVTTTLGQSRAAAFSGSAGSRTPHYLTSILLEWLLLGSVVAGIYGRGAFFLQTFRNRASGLAENLGLGLAAYFSGLLVLGLVSGALYFTPLFHKRNEALVLSMLPHTPLEFLVWFGVSLTAGITEELIFRGYLQQQLEAWTGNSIAAVLLGGLLFGSVHLYEGLGAILPLAALGILYGFLVRWRKGDLRAAVVAHTLQDFLVALIVLLKPLADKYQPHDAHAMAAHACTNFYALFSFFS